MKVGILTFHNAYNYGAILQTYATQEIVKQLGHDVEVINYHNKAIDEPYNRRKFHLSTMPKRQFYKIPTYIIEKLFFWIQRNAYHLFIKKYLNITREIYRQGDDVSLSKYDVILIGSDQLWNKNLTGGFDDVYWGDIKVSPTTRIIAWSVCMNNLKLTDQDNQYIKEHLRNFYALSVREDTLLLLIKNLTDKYIWHTLDPTMVLPVQKWNGLCHDVKEQNYIVVYAVRKESETVKFARYISRMLNKRLVIIWSYSRWYMSSENKEYGGPTDFISYIKNADLVVSTSFHGIVFSLTFERQFVCPSFGNDIRIGSLLKSLSLTDRIISQPDSITSLSNIDYKHVSKQRNELSKRTYGFLKEVFA